MTSEMVSHTSLLLRHGVFSHLPDVSLERLGRILQGSWEDFDLESLISIWHQGDYLSLPQGSELFFRTNILLMRMGRPPIDCCSFEDLQLCMQDA